MTNEEALNRFQRSYKLTKDYYDPHWEGGEYREHREWVEQLETAISALEKQIRKKPNLWNGKITTCPNCLRAIRQTEALDVHCMYCGQFIDWSDME